MSSKPSFNAVPSELDFPKYEKDILSFWKSQKIFEKSLNSRGPEAPQFVFYEGPPTANGMPHNGHVLTRVMKDVFPRFQVMRGKRVLRKGGWDTHGLPVEVEVEKELRIHGKEAILNYGVEPFVTRCIDSVFRYTSEWERLDDRIAYWISHKDAYVTYHRSYVESVWWALSKLFEKGLLYQGHKVIWWWAQGGTALSSAEVGLGYKTVDDPSAFVGFRLAEDESCALAVWTTTPWTLSSNSYAAVHPKHNYVKCRVGDALPKAKHVAEIQFTSLILAEALKEAMEQKLGRSLEVVESFSGESLCGKRYLPPFDTYYKEVGEHQSPLKDGGTRLSYFRIIAADFVTLSSGTGIVHIAPAFGEDDHRAHMKQLTDLNDPTSVPLLCAVGPDGKFTEVMGDYQGRWVKDADKDLLKDLTSNGSLLFHENYRHEYPFCWRSDQDPLIQMARPAWFIRTTSELDVAKANNQEVNWLPGHIKDGRFGDFLDNNVDWALSRERFWGTPLNIWRCDKCDHQEAPSSVAEIEKRNPHAFDHFHEAKKKEPSLSEHLMVHKPWIDQVEFSCSKCDGVMHRITEVIDCWFDSGCMPFAQWGYPHLPDSEAQFKDAFPADFISEAIDQTRGWFYSQLMVSSLLFDKELQAQIGIERPLPHPYKTCIVLGHVCDKEGKKESKSKGNYTPPEIILDKVAMEFALLNQAPGVDAEENIVQIAREDLEGMDLNDGSKVIVYATGSSESQTVTIRANKKLPRRVAVVTVELAKKLGLSEGAQGLDVKPVEVPSLPSVHRITVEDPNTPAPGADAFRWFFYASSPAWNNTRHSLQNVRLLQKDFIVKLRNVYSFFTIYANIDSWSPNDAEHAGQEVASRPLLDRFILSEYALTTKKIIDAMEGFLVFDAAIALQEFAEALSNWYVRRSRARFWASGMDQDKRNAYATLYECLVGLSQIAAPFIPYLCEEMYQNLVVQAGLASAKESVHLEDYPVPNESHIDHQLAREMAAVREAVSLGLSVRTAKKLKVRQPLSRVDVVLNDETLLESLEAHRGLIAEELNVHEVRLMHGHHVDGAVRFLLKPNFRALGPKIGKEVQALKQWLTQADGSLIHKEIGEKGSYLIELPSGTKVDVTSEELEVQVAAAEGFEAESGRVGVVVLHTILTDELLDEGYLRELSSRIQAARKLAQLGFTDRAKLKLSASERLLSIAKANEDFLSSECLIEELSYQALSSDESDSVESGAIQKVGDELLLLEIL